MRAQDITNLNRHTTSEDAAGILRLNEIEKVIAIKNLRVGSSVKKIKFVLSAAYFVVLTIFLIKLFS